LYRKGGGKGKGGARGTGAEAKGKKTSPTMPAFQKELGEQRREREKGGIDQRSRTKRRNTSFTRGRGEEGPITLSAPGQRKETQRGRRRTVHRAYTRGEKKREAISIPIWGKEGKTGRGLYSLLKKKRGSANKGKGGSRTDIVGEKKREGSSNLLKRRRVLLTGSRTAKKKERVPQVSDAGTPRQLGKGGGGGKKVRQPASSREKGIWARALSNEGVAWEERKEKVNFQRPEGRKRSGERARRCKRRRELNSVGGTGIGMFKRKGGKERYRGEREKKGKLHFRERRRRRS